MGQFTVRYSLPASGNKLYNNGNAGGWSWCINGSPTKAGLNVLSNCVGWACSRFNEIYNEITGNNGMKYKTLCCNAENFIERAKQAGLEVGMTPKPGAIMCWKKGATLSGSDGAGHGILRGQGAQKVQVCVHAAGLVRVHVVEHDGDAVILPRLDLCQHGLGIGHGLLVHGLEVLDRLCAVGDHRIPLLPAVRALAAGLHVKVPALSFGQRLDFHQLVIELVVTEVALIDVDLQVGGGQSLPGNLGGELVVADEAGPHIPRIPEGVAADGLEGVGDLGQLGIVHVKEDTVAEHQGHSGRTAGHRHLRRFQGKVGFPVGAVLVDGSPAHPVFQVVPGINIRIQLGVLHVHGAAAELPADAVSPGLPVRLGPALLFLGNRNLKGCRKGFFALIQAEQAAAQGERSTFSLGCLGACRDNHQGEGHHHSKQQR